MKFVTRSLGSRFVFLLLGLSISSGSKALTLFKEELYRPLIADKVACLPGDLLTVMVMETANAQTSADLSSGKDLKTALTADYNRNRQEISFGLHGQGKSTAKTLRNGKIKAALTVRILAITDDHSYEVEGQQLIQINGEQQSILLSGLVRPEDISPQNTVLSTRLADARITYTGKGTVSSSQRFNYLYKFMTFMGLV